MDCEERCPEGREVTDASLKLFSKVAGWTGKAAAWRVQHILGTAVLPGMHILDIGTGPGTIPLHLHRFHPDTYITGLDISLKMLEAASCHSKRKQVPLTLVAGDGQRLPFRNATIDFVISFFALHHMDRPEQLLTEVDRVLKPDGQVLMIDFRRDMAGWLFRLMDTLWQIVFCYSAGRRGFHESVRSAWRPDEIKHRVHENKLDRFHIHANWTELWIIRGKR